MKINKYAIFILWLLFKLNAAVAQDSTEYKMIYHPNWGSVVLTYGHEIVKESDFNNFFRTEHNVSLGKNMQHVGFDLVFKQAILIDPHIRFKYFLPQEVTINDTLTYTFKGYQYGQSYLGVNFLTYNPHFDLCFSSGFGFGRTVLIENDTKIKNPFFLLNLRLNPRVKLFKRLLLSAVTELSWDISKPVWKSKSDFIIENLDFKYTSVNFQLGLGYIINDRSSYHRIYY